MTSGVRWQVGKEIAQLVVAVVELVGHCITGQVDGQLIVADDRLQRQQSIAKTWKTDQSGH